MAERRLTPDEAGLWARVMAEVRPLRMVAAPAARPAKATPSSPSPPAGVAGKPGAAPAPRASPPAAKPLPARPETRLHRPAAPAGNARPAAGNTLDGSWDRQLSRGLVSPDRSIDLHGHTLGTAHALLDGALDQAIRDGDRVVLLVTGKPPRPTSERPHARGAIRAAVGDWLAASRHASAIAAVRGAHPRHGGAGALYIVLRRRRQAMD